MKRANRKPTLGRKKPSYEIRDGQIPLLPPGSSRSALGGRRGTRGREKAKRGKAERLIAGGICAASLSIVVSLSVYFRPFLEDNVFPAVKNLCTGIYTDVTAFINSHKKEAESPAKVAAFTPDTAQSQTPLLETQEEVPYMSHSQELGSISDMGAEPVYPPQEDAIYFYMMDTSLGPLLYYNQGDIRWKEYLYGGSDRLAKYGCGPVCVSMLINSFTPTSISPIEMADWSAANGYYARQSGSYHSLIPGSLEAFGLQVESVTDRTSDNARQLLNSGHVLVALMGRGALTQNGHFIIIAQLSSNGNVYIADPASYENSTKEWDLDLLMNELKKSYDSGGPLWAVSLSADGSSADAVHGGSGS